MEIDWHKYQIEVAEVFKSLGAHTEVDAHVKGARGEHDIDVWVTFDKFGVEVHWIVECKFWEEPISKEKVITLYQIAQDVGAERALLFSESGFQAGAVNSVSNTNVSLTSIEEFKGNAKQELVNSTLLRAIKEADELHIRIKALWLGVNGQIASFPNTDIDEVIGLDGTLIFLKMAIQRGLSGTLPISYPSVIDHSPTLSKDFGSLLANLASSLLEAKQKVAALENLRDEAIDLLSDHTKTLIERVERLLNATEKCLFETDEHSADFEELRLNALEEMRAIGTISDIIRPYPNGPIRDEVNSLMRLLIDTIYLYLTMPRVPRDQWETAKKRAGEQLVNLDKLISFP